MVRKCEIYSVHCNLYEFSFTKISKFPTVAFLRYLVPNELCLVYFPVLLLQCRSFGIIESF